MISDPAPPEQRAQDQDTRRLLGVVRSVVRDLSDGRGQGHISLDVSFERQLALGSLERVELVARVEKEFAVRLPQEAFGTAESPRQLLRLIRSARGSQPTQQPSNEHQGVSLLPTKRPAPEPLDAKTLVEVLEYHVRHQPNRTHIILRDEDGQDQAITYGDLYRSAATVAANLRRRGLAQGRGVALMLPTGLGYFAAFMGTLMAGGVPVPLYPPLRLDRIAEYVAREALILETAQAQVMVTFARAARVAELARDRVSSIECVVSVDNLLDGSGYAAGTFQCTATETDSAIIQFTSGSTGDPKGVELTHRSVLNNVRASRQGCALGPEDVLVSWLPLYHDMGLIGGWLMCFYYGVPTVVMSPMTFLARPARWLQTMSEFGATCSVAPNFAFELCVARISDDELEGLDLGAVRALLNGSEPILPATLDRFIERFSRIGMRRDALFCAYGLAENMVGVAFPPPGREPRIDEISREAFESEGRAIAPAPGQPTLAFVGVGSAIEGTEIRVVDDSGGAVPDRQQGCIHFRGTSMFKGYYGRPDATAEVMTSDGWVNTGDLGYLVDGELFITGRVKDIIIKGGRNYYPHEFEAATASVEGLRKGCAAAFAIRDDDSGTEQIIVVVETRTDDATMRDRILLQAGETIVAAVGVPADRIVLVAPGTVPKTSSGKIRRAETKRMFIDDELHRSHGSFASQAAGLYLRSVPARLKKLVRSAGAAVYGGYAIGALATACGVAPALGRVVPRGHAVRRANRVQAKGVLTLTGLRPSVTGLSHLRRGAAVLVANHCGYLDFLLCAAALPADIRFVIKGELRDNPYLGPYLSRTGHVFIDRHIAARSVADLAAVTQLLDEGAQVMLFPEGTFNAEVGLRPFKLGAFRLACERNVPVVPIAIRGSRRALPDGTWLPRRVPISVEVLAPLQPNGTQIADIVRLRDEAAESIAAHIDEPRLFAADISVPNNNA